MMTPARIGKGGYYRFEIDWTATLGFRIDRSSETRSLREYHALVALLWELRENGQIDVLRAFAKGDISIGALKQAKRAQRLKSDSILSDMALLRPLWHQDAKCPKAIDPKLPHSDECLGAIDITLPRMGRGKETRARYVTSLTKLRGFEVLPASALVRDLAAVDWSALRTRWAASGSDWNHLRRGISRFLSVLLDDVYHPFRRQVVKAIEIAPENERIPELTVEQFWAIVMRTPEHARPCYVTLAATGMRDRQEYLRCRKVNLNAKTCSIAVPGTKTAASKARIYVDPELWPWIEAGIPSPLQYKWMRIHWKRATLAEGHADLRLHDLRHLYAQLATDEGAASPKVQAALRHTDPRTTARYQAQKDRGEVARLVGRALLNRRVG